MRRTPISALVLASGLALVAGACGSSKTAAPATTVAPAAATTAAPAATTTAAAPAPTTAPPTTAAPAKTTAAAAAMMAADKPFGPACSAVPTSGAGSFDGMAKDPAATAASNNPVLSTLVATVKAAGLVDTLNSAGPFTIFAPYNDAFAKIDKATIDKLLADPKGDLTKILTYHVVAGQKLDAESAVKAGALKTVNGGTVTMTHTGDTFMVNGAKVLCGNVQTANATVFIIDSVLLPAAAPAPAAAAMMAADKPFGPACSAVPTSGAGSFDGMAKDPAATAASNNPVLSTLVATVKAAGLVDTLNSAGPFTIFAPYNDAFAKIDKATIDKLLADPKGDLTKILTLHVVAGQKLDAESAVKAGALKTVNGGTVTMTKTGDSFMVNGAKVLCGNVQTANATVFIIDTVLLPR